MELQQVVEEEEGENLRGIQREGEGRSEDDYGKEGLGGEGGKGGGRWRGFFGRSRAENWKEGGRSEGRRGL